jgi:hypothetical protein
MSVAASMLMRFSDADIALDARMELLQLISEALSNERACNARTACTGCGRADREVNRGTVLGGGREMSKGTTDKPMTLYDAIAAFLGPLEAEYARLIDECAHDVPVTIILGSHDRKGGGGYEYKTTMGAIQDMDRAFDAKVKRDAKKSVGTLL